MTASLQREADYTEMAAWFEASLRERVMPFWLRTAPDLERGGYRPHAVHPSSSGRRPPPGAPPLKPVAIQGRTLYGFSLAHRLGLAGESGRYLQAAEHGYRFLRDVLLDRQHGGLFAVAGDDGRIVDSRKLLYNQTFAIYGLVEYHRAGGDPAPLELALEVYQALHAHLHDREHGGWIEHADREFRPLRFTLPRQPGLPGVPELRSADALLHWMEALAELYHVTRRRDVETALVEALHLGRSCFYPAGRGTTYPYLTRDWRPVGGSRYDVFSYGHTLEFAWLMVRAQQVLGDTPDWEHFHHLVGQSLRWGHDRVRGGLYFKGPASGPATDRSKVWWVQAEAIAALCDGLLDRDERDYSEALRGLVGWVRRHHILSDDDIWITSTDEAGRPLDLTKAGPWKCAYHDVRAMAKFIETFG